MAWTYDDALDQPLYEVRFKIGDTDTNDQQLSDGEINYLLAQAGNNVLKAAVLSSRAIAAKYSRQVSKSIGQTSIQLQQRRDAYLSLAEDLEREQAETDSLSVTTFFASGETPDPVMPDITAFDLEEFLEGPT